MIRLSFYLAVLALGLGGCAPAQSQASDQPASGETQVVQSRDAAFSDWLAELKAEARNRGISQATLESAFRGLEAPIDRVLELDRRQPEFRLSFWRYLGNAVTEERVELGRAFLAAHRDLLQEVAAQYGVQPRFLIAFWGLETNYGSNFGSYPVIHALATLAYDPRRGDFFRGELFHALQIIDAGHIAASRMEGSWAGAMGHLQFMPSTFASYAIDGDGDGKRDIWNSLPDVFASAANFLSSLGWNGNETWGREVQLPGGFDYSLVSIETFPETRKPLAEWAALGVRAADGSPLPYSDQEAALLLPGGAEGPAFLVYENYRHILNWNRSILYAIAVGHLADRLVGEPPLVAEPPAEEARVSTENVKQMQSLLNRLGFDAGPPDGKVGPLTRNAIRDFQRSRNLPADGFPGATLLDNLRRAAGQ